MLALILLGLIVAAFVACLVSDIESDNTSALSAYDQCQYDAACTAAHQAAMAQFKASYPVKF